MSQVLNDVKAIKEAFEELLRDLSWATASQFPVGEELRQRYAKAEQQIVRSWNEQLYGAKPSATGLAELVQSAKIMRALRERMEEPVPPVPQLSAPAALNRAKRLIAAGAADEALHLLAAAKGSLDDAALGQLIPSVIPSEPSPPKPGDDQPPPPKRTGCFSSTVQGFQSWWKLRSQAPQTEKSISTKPTREQNTSRNWGQIRLWVGVAVVGLLLIGLVVQMVGFLNPPPVTPTPTRVANTPSPTVDPTKTPLPPITPTAVRATPTPTPTVTLSPTGTVETANPTPTGTVSGTTAPTSITLQLEPTTLSLHRLSTTTFTITGLPEGFSVGSGSGSVTSWKANIVNQSDSSPIVTGKLAMNQSGGQTSFTVTLTADDLTKLRQQFTGATTPELRLIFDTGNAPYRLPDVTLTVEERPAKGLPKVTAEGNFLPEYTEVITYLLNNKASQVYTDAQGLSFVPLFKTKDLGSRNSDIEPRTGRGTFSFPYQYPLVGNSDTVALLAEAETGTTKVYLVRIVKMTDPARAYGEGQTGWLPAVFIDGLN